eukprot:TRINITY_DN2786_c0_g1_i1.p1 TRINITY_DN2786_c0_g1~~TRINITY_DN2786_c0_g1_i1.p1  ORF type:complete len:206 (+),score=44.19 TRINITY_DN2786_c0_g1_i1:396-1013(+)
MDRYSEAITHYNKCLDTRDEHGIRVQRASCYQALGNYEKAIEDIDIAIAKNKDHYLNYMIRGQCYSKLNNIGEAAEDYKYFLQESEKEIKNMTDVVEYENQRAIHGNVSLDYVLCLLNLFMHQNNIPSDVVAIEPTGPIVFNKEWKDDLEERTRLVQDDTGIVNEIMRVLSDIHLYITTESLQSSQNQILHYFKNCINEHLRNTM